jgi:hypothetical protein
LPRNLSIRLIVLLVLLCPAPAAVAQSTVDLGQAVQPLNGPWKFQTGDSPLDPRTHQPLWAEPDFDDSNWRTADLTPPDGTWKASIGTGGEVPGWTAQGYPNYHGYAWYRLRVDLHASAASALALKMPPAFDDAYQVYAQGQWVGDFGHFTTNSVSASYAQTETFALPAISGPVTLAIRMWMEPASLLDKPGAGGMRGPPVLGDADVLHGMLALARHHRLRFVGSYVFELVLLVAAIAIAFGLWALDRAEPAFLWLGLNCVVILCFCCVFITANITTWISATAANQILDVTGALVLALWVLFWAAWFRLQPMRGLRIMVWSLAALLCAAYLSVVPPFYGTVVPIAAGRWAYNSPLVPETILSLLLVWVAVQGIRKNRVEGLLALPAILLNSLGHLSALSALLHLPSSFEPFGMQVGTYQLGTILALLMVTVLLLRRFLQSQREQEQWRLELEQARQVQQMLIPEKLPAFSAFQLESEYLPAQQVGGDFYQILPGTDGGLLLIIGDVSGKGLKAAMLVAMIVGAIRTLAEQSHDPLAMLEGLNRRLCGRLTHQFATCLAIYLRPNGEATAANAGHLAPYLNGHEVGFTGSLPLGLAEPAEFEKLPIALKPGDRLVLITDGIVEAQDARQQLFGFERTTKLMQQNQPATEVAKAAQRFGQEDDISVISVRLSGG